MRSKELLWFKHIDPVFTEPNAQIKLWTNGLVIKVLDSLAENH